MKNKKKKREFLFLLGIIFLITVFMVIVGEYQKDTELLKYGKTLLVPVLIFIYLIQTRKPKYLYLIALIFAWIANALFLGKIEGVFSKSSACYLIYWMIITYIIIVNTSFPNYKVLVLAIIPFLFFYFYILELIYVNVFDDMFWYISNGIFMVFLAGYSLSLYVMDSNKTNTYLFMSVLMFVFVQLIIAIDHYYLPVKVFKPIAFLLYAAGQLILSKVILLFNEEQSEIVTQ